MPARIAFATGLIRSAELVYWRKHSTLSAEVPSQESEDVADWARNRHSEAMLRNAKHISAPSITSRLVSPKKETSFYSFIMAVRMESRIGQVGGRLAKRSQK